MYLQKSSGGSTLESKAYNLMEGLAKSYGTLVYSNDRKVPGRRTLGLEESYIKAIIYKISYP